MPQAQIQVEYYNPSQTKKPSSVKSADGKYYKFWSNASCANVFGPDSVGKTYAIEYEIQPGKNGYGDSNVVVEAVLAPESYDDIPFPGDTPQATAVPSTSAVVPATSAVVPASSKDWSISVLAIAKSCIQANKTEADADRWLEWFKKKI